MVKTINQHAEKTITVTVRYFAILRDERGESEELTETKAKTPQALYEILREKHGFSLSCSQLSVAINDTFSQWNETLNEGDTVVFIPPVAGG